MEFDADRSGVIEYNEFVDFFTALSISQQYSKKKSPWDKDRMRALTAFITEIQNTQPSLSLKGALLLCPSTKSMACTHASKSACVSLFNLATGGGACAEVKSLHHVARLMERQAWPMKLIQRALTAAIPNLAFHSQVHGLAELQIKVVFTHLDALQRYLKLLQKTKFLDENMQLVVLRCIWQCISDCHGTDVHASFHLIVDSKLLHQAHHIITTMQATEAEEEDMCVVIKALYLRQSELDLAACWRVVFGEEQGASIGWPRFEPMLQLMCTTSSQKQQVQQHMIKIGTESGCQSSAVWLQTLIHFVRSCYWPLE